MLVISVMFFIVAGPFLINYVGSHEHGQSADYDQVFAAMEYRFAKGFLDIPGAVREFLISTWYVGLLPVSLLGFAVVHFNRRRKPSDIIMLDMWVVGLVIAAFHENIG